MLKQRLDKVIVERGLASSRERARAMIMEGKVHVGGVPAAKAGSMVAADVPVEVRGREMKYVSRGGLKLESAIVNFQVVVDGKISMDVGASTGGFTDCLLQRGAIKVYCIDVGYGQFAWKLRQDQRVHLMERTNMRYLEKVKIPDPIALATVDVSFISLVKVVPKVLEFLQPGGELIALIKPQFEVGKGRVEKGGVIRDASRREQAVGNVKDALESLGLNTVGIMESPVTGQKGNIEYLVYMIKK